jgi:hypothetical protein
VVSVFSSSEQDVDLYLVVLGEKLSSLSNLHFNVVLAGFRSHSNLLDLNGVLLGTALQLLLLFVLRLPEVHDPANWRTNSRAHFNKIQPGFKREFLSFVCLHFAEHFAVLIDDADRRDPNSIIHPWQIGLHGLSKLRSSDCVLLRKEKFDTFRRVNSGVNLCLKSVVVLTTAEASIVEVQSLAEGQISTDEDALFTLAKYVLQVTYDENRIRAKCVCEPGSIGNEFRRRIASSGYSAGFNDYSHFFRCV